MKAFTDQLIAFWEELDGGNRVQLVGAILVTVLVLIGVGIWWALTDLLGIVAPA